MYFKVLAKDFWEGGMIGRFRMHGTRALEPQVR